MRGSVGPFGSNQKTVAAMVPISPSESNMTENNGRLMPRNVTWRSLRRKSANRPTTASPPATP